MLWVLLVVAILFARLAVWALFFSYQTLHATGGELTSAPALPQSRGRAPRAAAWLDRLFRAASSPRPSRALRPRARRRRRGRTGGSPSGKHGARCCRTWHSRPS